MTMTLRLLLTPRDYRAAVRRGIRAARRDTARGAPAYPVGMKLRDGAVIALLLAGLVLLAGCTPGSEKQPAAGSSAPPASASPAPGDQTAPPDTPSPTGSATPTPAPTAKTVKLPTDCRAILSQSVLAQLKDVPLNDPAFGESGALADGSLVCNWADPRADTTRLTTKIQRMSRGLALDLLSSLADGQGFTCFTPDGGTRCEKTWKNTQYPVTDGRTLFWRQDVLIDTRYSNLAPKGYTSSIISSIWG